MMAPHERPANGPAAARAAAMQALIPVIETDRLILRAPRIEDFQLYAEIATGPRGRFILDEPSRDDAWFDFTQIVATWLLRGHGGWTIEERATGAPLGFVLLGFEPGDPEPELGFLLSEAAEGKGIAAEAAAAARDFGFATLELPALVSCIDADNARSLALARRLGAYEDTPVDWAHPGTLVFRHVPPEGAA